MKARLRSHGVGVSNIEFFPVSASVAIEEYRGALEVGAELGARRAVTHIHDKDDARAVDTLGRLCDLAAGFDLRLGLEFMGLTPACASLARATWFVRSVGRANIGIAVDALHLVRTGGTPAEVAALPPSLFCYAQLCDGFGFAVASDYRPEAFDRQSPGDGEWPLRELVEALPAETALDVEVPSTTLLKAGVPAVERARRAVAKSRALLARANPRR
jgi:sugar phosphate isomerase/epimerase